MAEMLSDRTIMRPAPPRFDTNNEASKESAASHPNGEDKDQAVFPSHAAP
jgi:hypothetical protein